MKTLNLTKLLTCFILLLGAVSIEAQPLVRQWVQKYNGPGNYWDEAHSLAFDNSGNCYITGYNQGSGTSVDYITIKYSLTGDSLWVKRYNSGGYDDATFVTVDALGYVYVT